MSAVVLSALGAMFYNLLPMFVGVAQDYRNMDNRSIGFISSMYFSGFTLTTGTAFFWIRRINWKTAIWTAMPVASLALVLAGYSRNPTILMLCMFIAGGAFSAIYGIGATALGDTSNPARWYGLKISAEALLGAVLLFVLPATLISSYGFLGMMAGLVLAVVLLAPVFGWLPSKGHMPMKKDDAPRSLPGTLKLAVWMGLFAVMSFILSATLIWAFVERIAITAGYEQVLVGKILSLTLVFAMSGSLLAMVMGDRFGSGKPFASAILMFLVSLAWLSQTTTVMDYAFSACLMNMAIGLGISYVITIVAELDMDGRYVVLTVPAIGVGVMSAPAIGGVLTVSREYTSIFMVGGVTVGVSLVAGLLALHSGNPIVAKLRDIKSTD